MLATPDALEQVLFGTAGLAPALSPGQIVIDMSTVGPDEVLSVAARMPEAVSLVDAPVRGSVPQATAGRLDIFVGANVGDYERVRPILQSLGSVRRMGGLGSGAAMKLVANLALGAAIVALGEALSLGESFALDRHTLLDALAESPIGPMVAAKRANVESGQFTPNFKLQLAAKDLRLVMEAASRQGPRSQTGQGESRLDGRSRGARRGRPRLFGGRGDDRRQMNKAGDDRQPRAAVVRVQRKERSR